jgi:hypothetical protein
MRWKKYANSTQCVEGGAEPLVRSFRPLHFSSQIAKPKFETGFTRPYRDGDDGLISVSIRSNRAVTVALVGVRRWS